jgi:hypothetical protein
VAIGLGGLVFAGLVVAFSSCQRSGRDLQLTQDMHKMAWNPGYAHFAMQIDLQNHLQIDL